LRSATQEEKDSIEQDDVDAPWLKHHLKTMEETVTAQIAKLFAVR
jgi:hypothetical protein